jgi:hypothetical protein
VFHGSAPIIAPVGDREKKTGNAMRVLALVDLSRVMQNTFILAFLSH